MKGAPGGSRVEVSELSSAMAVLADAMVSLATANEALSLNFFGSAKANTKRIKTSVALNVLSTVIAIGIILGLVDVSFGLSRVRSTQAATNQTLHLVQEATNPNSSYSKARAVISSGIVAQEIACIENNTARSVAFILHQSVPALVQGCPTAAP